MKFGRIEFVSAKQIVFPVVALVIIIQTGCTSFRSIIMDRNPDDSLTPQCNLSRTRGIPVKLKVPTHEEVTIYETYFVKSAETKNKDVVSPPSIQVLSPNGNARLLSVKRVPIYTEKVFTVDFPRPLAGNLSLGNGLAANSDGVASNGIEFDADQYFKSIRGQVQDKTINTFNKILGGETEGEENSFIPFNATDNQQYARRTRVVAFKRFDISEPGWEQEMNAFIDSVIGPCNSPCSGGCNTPSCSPAPIPIVNPVEAAPNIIKENK